MGDPRVDWEALMAAEDELELAAEERERRIEQTPVPREQGYRPDPMHERRLDAIWAVLKRELPGTGTCVRGTAAYTADERRRLCEEILAAAETGI
jgi:hypothetical protein